MGGWIKPSKPVKHAEAQKNQGRIYCSTDEVQGGQQLKKGDKVIFKIFSGKQGLRADAVRKIGSAVIANSPAPNKNPLLVKAGTNGVKKTIEKPKAAQPGRKDFKPKPPSGAPPSLPPNWQECWSDEHDIAYYWNKVTKQSS